MTYIILYLFIGSIYATYCAIDAILFLLKWQSKGGQIPKWSFTITSIFFHFLEYMVFWPWFVYNHYKG